jgi:hypothetical protein
MNKFCLILFSIFFLTSCASIDQNHHELNLNQNSDHQNLQQIQIRNLKTFIKIPKSNRYLNHSNRRLKKAFFDDLMILDRQDRRVASGFFLFSDALISDLKQMQLKKDFKKIRLVIEEKANIAFNSENNQFKKYSFEIRDKKSNIYGYFFIKKIFINQNNETCKNFEYMICDLQKSVIKGEACKTKTNKGEIFWDLTYETDKKNLGLSLDLILDLDY